ncbi:hypothetical protein CHARACLAT_028113 [Characodon lateralis]|uniref:Uncharacterized protein n=1 Tax=Characodon lateralis TaxID=208331 RepID=A0ABU7F6Q0_9TELE|nr:hypothetical protein [Characodon lateralis]
MIRCRLSIVPEIRLRACMLSPLGYRQATAGRAGLVLFSISPWCRLNILSVFSHPSDSRLSSTPHEDTVPRLACSHSSSPPSPAGQLDAAFCLLCHSAGLQAEERGMVLVKEKSNTEGEDLKTKYSSIRPLSLAVHKQLEVYGA